LADILGAGIAFPLQVDRRGGLALARDETDIDQAIELILGTAPGERPMRPEFGCRIHDHVFGPANSATAGQIAYDVREALERWEPRISVEDVSVSYDRIEAGVLYVDVGYLILGSNDPRNLVFPFYVIPEHPDNELASTAALPIEPVSIELGGRPPRPPALHRGV